MRENHKDSKIETIERSDRTIRELVDQVVKGLGLNEDLSSAKIFYNALVEQRGDIKLSNPLVNAPKDGVIINKESMPFKSESVLDKKVVDSQTMDLNKKPKVDFSSYIDGAAKRNGQESTPFKVEDLLGKDVVGSKIMKPNEKPNGDSSSYLADLIEKHIKTKPINNEMFFDSLFQPIEKERFVNKPTPALSKLRI